ncbi:MAG: hypothetical protein II842_05920 [Butyrivibrio sp.]|nr:hypothetical protein [Butyrivibrio sp.]
MNKTIKKIISLISVIVLVAAISFSMPPVEASAADEITIIGTIIQTRSYYMINGNVNVYGFLPSMLTEVKVDGKTVELTECGAATTDTFGTNDLSAYVGVMRAYKGKVYKNKTADPYKYCFALTGVEEIPAGTQVGNKTYMDAYLTGLGYKVESFEYAPGEIAYHAGIDGTRVYFYYYMHNGIWGEISAVVNKPDYTGAELQYIENGSAVGGFAKAQKVAKIFAQYATGAITKDAADKALKALL